jgi:hypothetical protein
MYSHFVSIHVYLIVPLTYFCGHLLDINKIILSYLPLTYPPPLYHLPPLLQNLEKKR